MTGLLWVLAGSAQAQITWSGHVKISEKGMVTLFNPHNTSIQLSPYLTEKLAWELAQVCPKLQSAQVESPTAVDDEGLAPPSAPVNDQMPEVTIEHVGDAQTTGQINGVPFAISTNSLHGLLFLLSRAQADAEYGGQTNEKTGTIRKSSDDAKLSLDGVPLRVTDPIMEQVLGKFDGQSVTLLVRETKGNPTEEFLGLERTVYEGHIFERTVLVTGGTMDGGSPRYKINDMHGNLLWTKAVCLIPTRWGCIGTDGPPLAWPTPKELGLPERAASTDSSDSDPLLPLQESYPPVPPPIKGVLDRGLIEKLPARD
jgi:hypothetical protein